MTTSVRFTARPQLAEIYPGIDSAWLNTAPVVAFGSQELTEDRVLRYRAASVRAQELDIISASIDIDDHVRGPEFERNRTAWMLAKEVVEFSTELGGDMSVYLDQLTSDPGQKAKVANFIPAALDAYHMLQQPVS